MASDSRPDIVVGIDFGMTSTGVAYGIGPSWADPKPLQTWPGKNGIELRNKVPTALAYDSRGEKLKSWGCLVDFGDANSLLVELWKLHLDPNFHDADEDSHTLAEAQRYFKDFMFCLREYIEAFLEQFVPRSKEKAIEYLISTPTTWRSPGVIAIIRGLLEECGYAGPDNKNILTMSLTEAEAAAVYSAKFAYNPGDILMVCDAGGGTTDLNVLSVQSTSNGVVQLEQLQWVEGEAIGSTLIDFHMEQRIAQRLHGLTGLLRSSAEQTAEELMRLDGKFESYKCAFGSETVDNTRPLRLRVPGLRDGQTFEAAGIVDSDLIITREELQDLFDQQVQSMFALIDDYLNRMTSRRPGQRVAYLILSGGLGSSPYVRQKMVDRYRVGLSPEAPGITVLVAAEAQLAVAYGLVSDRIQGLREGPAIFENHCARNSYGVVTQELYDPPRHKHLGSKVYINKSDGKKWVNNQIHWLLKKGEHVSTVRGVSQPCRLRLEVGHESRPWQVQIVMSSVELPGLPDSKTDPAIEPVCTVTSLIDPSLMKMKNKHWYQTKQPYWLAEFQLKVIVGAADLRFELWDSSGTKCSREHDRITVNVNGIQRGEGQVHEVEG